MLSYIYVKITVYLLLCLTFCLSIGANFAGKPNNLKKAGESAKKSSVQIMDLINPDNDKKEIKWVSLDEAFDKARRDNKKILIFVHTDWCGYCKMMQKKAFRNSDVVQYMDQKYVAVKLNAWSKEVLWFAGYKFRFIDELNIHQLAYQLLDGKMEYPTCVVLNYQYEIVAPIKGYMEARTFLKALKYYGEDAYLEQTWYQYNNSR